MKISKLEYIRGLKRILMNWMGDYLKKEKMRTIVRDEKSEWQKVKTVVLQGSILAPIVFLVHINDITEGISSLISLFADNAK